MKQSSATDGQGDRKERIVPFRPERPTDAQESSRESKRPVYVEEERCRAIFEHANDVIVLVDPTGTIITANPRVESLLGYAPAEIVGKKFAELPMVPPERLPDMTRLFDAAIETKDVVASPGESRNTIKISLRHKDGTVLDCRLRVGLLDPLDPSRGYVGILTDVTGRKQAEETLRRANRELRTIGQCHRTLIRAAHEHELLDSLCRTLVSDGGYCMAWVGFAEHDADGTVRPVAQAGHTDGYFDEVKITWSNTAYGQEPAGKAIYTGIPHLVSDLTTDPSYTSWRAEAIKRGYASSIALPLAAGGQTLGVLSVYAAKPDAFDSDEIDLLSQLADEVAYGVTALRTRAQRDLAEEAMRESEERFRQIFENMSSGVIVYEAAKDGEDFIIKDLNRASTRIDDINREQAIGRSVLEVFPGVKNLGLFQVFQRVWRSGQPEHHPASRYEDERISGWRENDVYRLPSGELVVIYDDVTERKKAEQQLLDHRNSLRELATELTLVEERERRRIAVGVHDQIAQRLALIKLTLQSLGASCSENSTARALEGVCRELDQSMADAHSLTFELSNPVLYEAGFADAVESWLAKQVREKYGIEYTFEADESDADLNKEARVGLFHIVRELLMNVIKHAKAKRVDVRIQRTGDAIQVAVQDAGVGFEPSEAGKCVSPAGGFGLFNVREKLQYMGGSLKIDSAPGEGTCVVAVVPLRGSRGLKEGERREVP